MKILQHVSALLRICVWQRCAEGRYEFKSLCANCKLRHFWVSHPVWRVGMSGAVSFRLL